MIAPRKKLWSTPDEIISILHDWIPPLKDTDVVLDVGCGDAKVLIQWAAAAAASPRYMGIEIDEARSQQAKQNVEQAKRDGILDETVVIDIYCGNALELTDLYQQATVIFLYLIPRGLRLIKPILMEHAAAANNNKILQVVTYMSPLPDETPVKQTNCTVEHQPGAAWPLYLYHLQGSSSSSSSKEDDEA